MITRRRLLTSVLGLALAPSRPGIAAAKSMGGAPRRPPIVVVGAGLTGLVTAHELRKAGLDVVVLEASSRAGGRIQTVTFEDGVHAEAYMEEFWRRSPAYELLTELGVPLAPGVAHSAVRLQGQVLPYRGHGDRETYLAGLFTESERLALARWNESTWTLYQRLAKSTGRDRPHDGSGTTPVLDDELLALTTVSFADWIQQAQLPPKVSEWLRVTLEPEIAVAWDAISALDGIDEMRLFLDTSEGFGETNYHVRGGNSRLVDALVARVGRTRIRFGARVSAVSQEDGRVRVRYLEDETRYRVLDARAVVLTVPLPALDRLQLTPPLPREKRQAIETTHFGAYVKAHVRLAPAAERLWTPADEDAALLTLLSDSPAGSIYDVGDFQPLRPESDRCLTLLVHASFAQRMLAMDGDEMRGHLVAGLEALFPGIAANVRGMELFVYPKAVAYWPVALGRSRFDALAAALRRPEGAVWIGGDMTEGSHSEGAVRSAYRIAAEIIARERRPAQPPSRPLSRAQMPGQ